ncbi:hypothetical protein AVEN_34886-1, partial [Araneus ventricosus]
FAVGTESVKGAFRTTSTATLQVICGIEPIDLILEKEKAIYFAKKNSTSVSFLDHDLREFNLEHYNENWIHPSSIKPVQPTSFHIYGWLKDERQSWSGFLHCVALT